MRRPVANSLAKLVTSETRNVHFICYDHSLSAMMTELRFSLVRDGYAIFGWMNEQNINTFKGHSNKFYVSLYKTYVRPLLESASPVWSPYLKCNINNRISSAVLHKKAFWFEGHSIHRKIVSPKFKQT